MMWPRRLTTQRQKDTAMIHILFISLSFTLVTDLFLASESFGADSVKVAPGPVFIPRLKKIQDQFEKESGAKLVILSKDGMTGESLFAAIDRGTADVMFTGISWDELVAVTKEKKYEPLNIDKLKHKVIANGVINFVTYIGGPKELTQEQLTGLFTGKVKNWKEIGGADLPVTIVIPQNNSGNQKMLKDKVFGGVDFQRAGARFFANYHEMSDFIGKTPGAVGWGPKALPLANVNHPKHISLVRPMIMVTKGEPSPTALKLVELLVPGGDLPTD